MRNSLLISLGAGLALVVVVWTASTAVAYASPAPTASLPTRASPREKADTKAETKLAALLADRFGSDPVKQENARKQLVGWPVDAKVRDLAWQVYKAAPAQAALRAEWETKTVSTADRVSPYLWRYVGTKPAGGWGLVIAMHGGGAAPKQVNDNEWRYMFSTYYREHPENGGYVYLALRAPNDTWNGFYDDAICPLVEKLIKEFVLCADVDPDKVYTMGASHGGCGAFVIGPKIPDRFAAIHAAASAPTDGETMGENLRDVRFTFIVGEKDKDYGRYDRCHKFEDQVEKWRAQYGGFPAARDWKRPPIPASPPLSASRSV